MAGQLFVIFAFRKNHPLFFFADVGESGSMCRGAAPLNAFIPAYPWQPPFFEMSSQSSLLEHEASRTEKVCGR